MHVLQVSLKRADFRVLYTPTGVARERLANEDRDISSHSTTGLRGDPVDNKRPGEMYPTTEEVRVSDKRTTGWSMAGGLSQLSFLFVLVSLDQGSSACLSNHVRS